MFYMTSILYIRRKISSKQHASKLAIRHFQISAEKGLQYSKKTLFYSFT